MNLTTPQVSIGMPVFNAERYIRQALDSLLAQDFKDFELVISDNASEDRTQDICLEYVARDKRIRYHQNQTNIGLDPNFRHVFQLSTAPYFTWASSDDTRHTEFLSSTVAILDAEPQVVLCYSKVVLIDAAGEPIEPANDNLHIRLPDPAGRFRKCIWSVTMGTPVHSLIRSDALKKSRPFGGFINSDLVLLAELSLQGEFHQVDRPLFFRRMHPDQAAKKVLQEKKPWVLDPTNRRRLNLRWSYACYQTIKVVKRAQLSRIEKVRLMLAVLRCFKTRHGQRIKAELTTELRSELKRLAKDWWQHRKRKAET